MCRQFASFYLLVFWIAAVSLAIPESFLNPWNTAGLAETNWRGEIATRASKEAAFAVAPPKRRSSSRSISSFAVSMFQSSSRCWVVLRAGARVR